MRTFAVIVCLFGLATPAWAISNSQVQRTADCMADATTRDDREKIARVLVQALVEERVQHDDMMTFSFIMLGKMTGCGVDLESLANDKDALESISSTYMEKLLANGLRSIQE